MLRHESGINWTTADDIPDDKMGERMGRMNKLKGRLSPPGVEEEDMVPHLSRVKVRNPIND